MNELCLVVAVDHPRAALPVAEVVASLFGDRSCRAVVVHIHQFVQGDFGVAALQRESDVDCVALDVADELCRGGLPATARSVPTEDRDLASAICKAAVEESASLVVLGTHSLIDSHARPARTLAERVQRLSALPVLLVPAP